MWSFSCKIENCDDRHHHHNLFYHLGIHHHNGIHHHHHHYHPCHYFIRCNIFLSPRPKITLHLPTSSITNCDSNFYFHQLLHDLQNHVTTVSHSSSPLPPPTTETLRAGDELRHFKHFHQTKSQPETVPSIYERAPQDNKFSPSHTVLPPSSPDKSESQL